MPLPMWLAVPDLPAPMWLVVVLHVVTLGLHWFTMNLMLAGAFHLAVAKPGELRLQAKLAAAIPPLVSLTVTLGVAPLLFLQLVHGEQFYSSSIRMAWPWLLSLAVLGVGYYAAYACDFKGRADKPMPRWLRALPFAGMLFFSFVITANVALAETPKVLGAIKESGWSMAIIDTMMLPRWGHEILGAVALGSVLLLHFGHNTRESDPELADSWIGRGVRTAFIATGAGILLGIVQLFTDVEAISGALSGILLLLGILLGIGSVAHLWLYQKRGNKRTLMVASVMILVTLLVKAALRLTIRANRLELADATPTINENVAFSPILLFLVCFIVALGVVGWMLKLVFGKDAEGGPA